MHFLIVAYLDLAKQSPRRKNHFLLMAIINIGDAIGEWPRVCTNTYTHTINQYSGAPTGFVVCRSVIGRCPHTLGDQSHKWISVWVAGDPVEGDGSFLWDGNTLPCLWPPLPVVSFGDTFWNFAFERWVMWMVKPTRIRVLTCEYVIHFYLSRLL